MTNGQAGRSVDVTDVRRLDVRGVVIAQCDRSQALCLVGRGWAHQHSGEREEHPSTLVEALLSRNVFHEL